MGTARFEDDYWASPVRGMENLGAHDYHTNGKYVEAWAEWPEGGSMHHGRIRDTTVGDELSTWVKDPGLSVTEGAHVRVWLCFKTFNVRISTALPGRLIGCSNDASTPSGSFAGS